MLNRSFTLCSGFLLAGWFFSTTWSAVAQVNPLTKEFTTQISVSFEPPPGQDQPLRTAGGGSRDGGRCAYDPIGGVPLAAIASTDNHLPIRPPVAVQIQIPQTSAQSAEFSLFDHLGNGVYQTSLPLPTTPGVIDIHLPTDRSMLEAGRDYQWIFAIICEPGDRLQDRSVSGWIRPD